MFKTIKAVSRVTQEVSAESGETLITAAAIMTSSLKLLEKQLTRQHFIEDRLTAYFENLPEEHFAQLAKDRFDLKEIPTLQKKD